MLTSDNAMASLPALGGVATLQQHFAYNQWANERILQTIAALPDEALRAEGKTDHGSAFQLLLHTLDTEWGWRIISQRGEVTPLLWEVEALPDLAAVARFWVGEHAEMQAYLASLTDADLSRPVDFGTLQGGAPKHAPVAALLSHILYHSSGHRAELATYLTHCGHSPGELQFLDYVDYATST